MSMQMCAHGCGQVIEHVALLLLERGDGRQHPARCSGCPRGCECRSCPCACRRRGAAHARPGCWWALPPPCARRLTGLVPTGGWPRPCRPPSGPGTLVPCAAVEPLRPLPRSWGPGRQDAAASRLATGGRARVASASANCCFSSAMLARASASSASSWAMRAFLGSASVTPLVHHASSHPVQHHFSGQFAPGHPSAKPDA